MVPTKTLDFASQFRQCRKQRNLSIVRLFELSGIGKTTLENWQSGRTLPSAPELETLISVLNLSSFDQRLLRRSIGLPRAIVCLPEGERPPLTGGLLRAMRLRRGLTQSEVARRLAVRQGTLAKWEKSDDWPEADKLSLLCLLLGASHQETEAILGGVFLPLPLPLNASLEDFEQQIQILNDRANRCPNDPLLDLAFLEIESQIWLDVDRPAAQELLWKIWGFHNTHLSIHQRFDELFSRANQMLAIAFDPLKSSTSFLQSAVIHKSVALRGTPNGKIESASRRKSAITFLKANEGRMGNPECQAWYWMVLVDLLTVEGAYDEARFCLDRSNAIPHPAFERGTKGESALMTAYSLTNLGSPREALALLSSSNFRDSAKHFVPILSMRSLLYCARALAKLEDFAGALEVLDQLYNQIEVTGIEVMRPRADALFFQLTHLP
ncbi:helix-turn-helix transcriptional regulator [Armatimonas sp.]|uniref:helix-turn-helix transcriptional regulator n=1 Tax=Armatimonas sp. TaxID=1872638 RepID=UPI00286C43C5|nr:helix-turn-helix transcriptional regulator [Armatimonas sp.]